MDMLEAGLNQVNGVNIMLYFLAYVGHVFWMVTDLTSFPRKSLNFRTSHNDSHMLL